MRKYFWDTKSLFYYFDTKSFTWNKSLFWESFWSFWSTKSFETLTHHYFWHSLITLQYLVIIWVTHLSHYFTEKISLSWLAEPFSFIKLVWMGFHRFQLIWLIVTKTFCIVHAGSKLALSLPFKTTIKPHVGYFQCVRTIESFSPLIWS